jgi:tRNA-dihydrouridine synthase
MIGRASRGRPWIFRQCLEYLPTGSYRQATIQERLETAILHARLLEAEVGPKACYRLRTILMWYTRELPGAAALRAAICREDNVSRQLELLTAAMTAGDPSQTNEPSQADGPSQVDEPFQTDEPLQTDEPANPQA